MHALRLLFFLTLMLASCSRNERTVSPVEKPLLEAVYASGYVVSKNEFQVFAQAEGYVAEKLVEDGQVVRQGDALYILERDQQDSRFNLARQNYVVAQQNYSSDSPVLKELQTALATARTKKAYDSINFQRYQNLLTQQATTRAEYDRAELAFRNSTNEYLVLKSRYAQLRNQLFLEFQQAKSQLQIAGSETGRYTVRSSIDGRVFKTFKEKGELVRRTEVVALVGNDNAFYVQLNVDELDVQRIKTGQEVLVKVDAYPQRIFKATIEKIYPLIDRQQQSLRVDAALQDTLPQAYSGLSIEANIVIRKKDKALVLPKNVFVSDDSVLLKTAEGRRRVFVRKGAETLEEVEVVEGIKPTDVVIY